MKKTLLLIFLSSLFLFSSCNSDDDNPTPEPTIQEIQQDIENTFDGFVVCMQGYENGAFSNAIQNFFMISNGDMNSEYSEMLTDKLEEFNFDLENFSMANHSGVYNWNSNMDSWSYVSNTNNELIFNFPFSSSSTSNNTTVVINDYVSQEFNTGFETEYYPTKILGSIEKDNNEIFNIDLDNVSYQNQGGEISPVSFNLEIRTEPMTHLFNLTEISSNEFEFDYSSHNDNSCSTTFSIDASTTISDFTFAEDIEDFANISGKIGHDNLEIRFNAQVDNLTGIEDPTANQVNQLIEANVYLGNTKVGELEFDDSNNEKIIYIVYNDGTRENVANYINEELSNELEAIFSNYID